MEHQRERRTIGMKERGHVLHQSVSSVIFIKWYTMAGEVKGHALLLCVCATMATAQCDFISFTVVRASPPPDHVYLSLISLPPSHSAPVSHKPVCSAPCICSLHSWLCPLPFHQHHHNVWWWAARLWFYSSQEEARWETRQPISLLKHDALRTTSQRTLTKHKNSDNTAQ